jgi:hypothetical protein
MDKDVESSDGDDNWALDRRLPAIIPMSRPPVAIPPFWRLLLPNLHLTLVAAFASSVGILAAMQWPYQARLAAVLHPAPSGPEAGSPDVDAAALPLVPPADVPSTPASSPLVQAPPIPSIPLRVTADTPSASAAGDACRGPFPAAQLEVSASPTVMPADAPALLNLTINGAPDSAQLIICGFAARSVFSAGYSIDENSWILPVSDASDLTLIPPHRFVGPMKLVVALLNTDRSLADRRTVLLQWLPQTSGVPAAVPRMADINEQLEEGKRLRAAGNLPGARAIFQRLAQTGDSRAAFLLAETYDPISLAKHQLLPPDSDPEKARLWYRRALERGSPDANGRLDRLSNW